MTDTNIKLSLPQKPKLTDRGFEIIEFKDEFGEKCSLQQSSIMIDSVNPGESAIWLGIDHDNRRMHLTHTQVESLIKLLSNWVKSGSFE